jgi:hypothetical protein
MGFFTQPWVLLVLALIVTFVVIRWRKDLMRKQALATLDGKASNAKTNTVYRCRSCPQRFEPPNLFYICPVCQSPVDKFENGVAVDEPNPAFPEASPASRHGTLPFTRRDSSDADTGKKPGKAVQKRKLVAPNENVVALNLKAVDNLHRTCWLVVVAESGELAQNIAEHSANFRVLYRKPPKRLSKNRWLVWGKARSAA